MLSCLPSCTRYSEFLIGVQRAICSNTPAAAMCVHPQAGAFHNGWACAVLVKIQLGISLALGSVRLVGVEMRKSKFKTGPLGD